MNAALRFFCLFPVLMLGFDELQAATTATNKPTGFRLIVELRDGSRVIGKSGDDALKFHSDVLGEMKLPLGRIRSVKCQAETDSAQLTTSGGDTLAVEFGIKEIRIEAAFGNFKLPVNLIRSLQVSPMGVSGKSQLGLVALWPGEGNANDIMGVNNGLASGVMSYTNGEVGQAFTFDGSSGYISVPASPSLDIGATGSGITIECWINENTLDDQGPIVEWSAASVSSTGDGVQLWPGSTLFANLRDTANNPHRIESATGVLVAKQFQHVAVTYDKNSGAANLYVDGVVVASRNMGSFTPQTTYPTMSIGKRISQPIGLGDTFHGLLDELSIYNRALSSNEIAAIYCAGSQANVTGLFPRK